MIHKKVFEKHQAMFNCDRVDTWFQNGYNSVRIRFENKKEVVFTYHDDDNWWLETVNIFISNMNSRRKGAVKC